MPQPKGRKEQTRRRILDAAARLFVAKGFQATSIEEVMADCGLTRGGFYAHFRSKAQLYQEAIASTPVVDAAMSEERDGADWLHILLSACARDQHSTTRDAPPWAFLAKDVASADVEVRRGYADVLTGICNRLEQQLTQADLEGRNSLAAMAMVVGALAINLSIDDAELRVSIAEACRTALNKLQRDEPTFFWRAEKIDLALLPRCFRPMANSELRNSVGP